MPGYTPLVCPFCTNEHMGPVDINDGGVCVVCEQSVQFIPQPIDTETPDLFEVAA